MNAMRKPAAPSSSLDRAMMNWGRVPDWVAALAEECDRTSQAKAAERVGYSASVVNQVLANSYRGKIAAVERAVRLELLPERVLCPVFGAITTTRCAFEQEKPYSGINPLRRAIWRQCPNCPNRDADQLAKRPPIGALDDGRGR